MPALIQHIDAIARREGRDVLYLEFHPQPYPDWRAYRHGDDTMRAQVLAWLDAHGVGWRACGAFADPAIMEPWLGQVYLDLPYDETRADYCQLRDYLELPDGSMRHAGVRFCVMPMDYANRNAEHDVPGFWERWADDL